MSERNDSPDPTLVGDTKDGAASGHEPTKPEVTEEQEAPPKTWRFWLVFVSLCLTSLATSLENTIFPIALPTVTHDLGGQENYVWMSSSFLLASTVVQPFVGQLANIFGRRNPMIASLLLFILGSGIGGGATNVSMLIAGRSIQGMGCGGLYVLLDIITCDMVPLRERGKYLGLVLSTGALGATLGPIIGGAIAQANWRWIFYLNLPLGGLALVFMTCFLSLKHTPSASLSHSLARIDYIGSALFIASTTAVLLGLIMGGTTYAWGTYHVIVPIVLGFVGWAAFHVYEASPVCKEPSVPPHMFSNRTSFVGFFLAFDAAMLLVWAIMFLPVYYQGVLGTSPLGSGVDMLPFNIFMIPPGMVAGGVMAKLGQYKPFHWAGFAIAAIGYGLFTLLDAGSSRAAWVCFEIITAVGLGVLMTTILPAIQTALTDADTASSTSLFSFLRSFGFTWGVALPAIIFNNVTNNNTHLISDPSVAAQLSGGRAYNMVTGNFVQSLPPATQQEVVAVFTYGLKAVWQAGIALCLLGFALTFVEKRLVMRTELSTDYGLEESDKKGAQAVDEEAATAAHSAGTEDAAAKEIPADEPSTDEPKA